MEASSPRGRQRRQGDVLPDIWGVLRWRWRLAALVAAAFVGGATLYAETLPDRYRVEAIVSVSPRTAEVSPTAVTVGAPRYVAYATAPATLERVGAELGESLDRAVDAQLAANTGDITIIAELPDPDRAQQAANAVAGEVIDYSAGDRLLTVSLVARAIEPTQPSGPPRRTIEVAALLLALAAGTASALAAERMSPRLRSWQDMAAATEYPVIGRLPRSRAIRQGVTQAMADPVVAPAVRMLRTNLERRVDGRIHGSIALTSAVAGEGKTAVSLLLATALAKLDLKVLVVDGDLHRATLSLSMGKPGARTDRSGGFSATLRGELPLRQSALSTNTPGLFILPTRVVPDAGDLVSRRFQQVIDDAEDLFDVVVVDTPPILSSDHASAITTMVNGTLLVVTAGSRSDLLSEAVSFLNGLRVPVWGLVANRLSARSGDVAGYAKYA